MAERINSKVEQGTRDLLGHALHVNEEEFEGCLRQLSSDGLLPSAIVLAKQITAVAAIDQCNGEVPNAAALREIADTTVAIEDEYNLEGKEVHAFLARVVFGSESVDSVLEPLDATRLPFIIASNLVSSGRDADNGQEWWDYLNAIETTIEQANDPV